MSVLQGLEEGLPIDVDFAVVHALLPSCDLASVHPGKLAAKTERQKRRENTAITDMFLRTSENLYFRPSALCYKVFIFL